MSRWPFHIFAGISMLLLVLTLVLWVRSYSRRDMWTFGRAKGTHHMVQSLLGRVHWRTSLNGVYEEGGFTYYGDRLVPNALWNGGSSGYPKPPEWRWGFVWQTYTPPAPFISVTLAPGAVFILLPPEQFRLIVVPYWFLAGCFAVLPGMWLVMCSRGWRQGRLKARGMCVTCGYDLRATPDRCPECGAVPQEAKGAAG